MNPIQEHRIWLLVDVAVIYATRRFIFRFWVFRAIGWTLDIASGSGIGLNLGVLIWSMLRIFHRDLVSSPSLWWGFSGATMAIVSVELSRLWHKHWAERVLEYDGQNVDIEICNRRYRVER